MPWVDVLPAPTLALCPTHIFRPEQAQDHGGAIQRILFSSLQPEFHVGRRKWMILFCCFLWNSYICFLCWIMFSLLNFLNMNFLWIMNQHVSFPPKYSTTLAFPKSGEQDPPSVIRAFARNSSSVKTQASVTCSSFKLWKAKLISLTVLKAHLLLAYSIWYV